MVADGYADVGGAWQPAEWQIANLRPVERVGAVHRDDVVAAHRLKNEAEVVEKIPDVARGRGDIEAAVGDDSLTDGRRAADVNAGGCSLSDGAQRKGNSQRTRKTEKNWFHECHLLVS